MWGKQLLKCEQLKAQLDPSFGGSSLCLRQRISLNCNMIFFFSVGCKRKGCLALFAGKKLGFCFHGDLEFSVLWGCKLLLCFTSMFQRKGEQVTVSHSWEKLWNSSRDAWMGLLELLTWANPPWDWCCFSTGLITASLIIPWPEPPGDQVLLFAD